MKINTNKLIILYPDFYDATTASYRLLNACKGLFEAITFCYWARTGTPRINADKIYADVGFDVFTETAKPRSLNVFLLTLKFQLWQLRMLRKNKPSIIIAVTFFSIFPALLYRYFVNRKCRVVYDPRDYIGTSFLVNVIIRYTLQFFDSLFSVWADFVIFPDTQYFHYYGLFKLKENKYFILPNSTEDFYDKLREEHTRQIYKIGHNKLIIPYIGYLSETRGKRKLFTQIAKNNPKLHFIIAGDIRDPEDLAFFSNRDNVTFLGRIPFLEALAIMRDSAVIPLAHDPSSLNNKFAYPTKFYDGLMVGTPIIASSGQVLLAKEVSENNLGFIIEYDNSDMFEQVLNQFISGEAIFDSKKLREEFLKKYDYDFFRPKLTAKIASVLGT